METDKFVMTERRLTQTEVEALLIKVLGLRGKSKFSWIDDCEKGTAVQVVTVQRANGFDEAPDYKVLGELDEVRPEVARHALLMERKLKDNDHKTHWRNMDLPYLLKRLHQEMEELKEAIVKGKSPRDVEWEAADVGNFAMMIADAWANGTLHVALNPEATNKLVIPCTECDGLQDCCKCPGVDGRGGK